MCRWAIKAKCLSKLPFSFTLGAEKDPHDYNFSVPILWSLPFQASTEYLKMEEDGAGEMAM